MGRIKAVIMKYHDVTNWFNDSPRTEDLPLWLRAGLTDEQLREMDDDEKGGGHA